MWSDTAGVFLQAILAEPEQDEPRLLFADWLEEQGDARGELIRLQCALAADRCHPVTPLPLTDRLALQQREADLLLAHRDEWGLPLQGWATPKTFLARGPELYWICQRGAIPNLILSTDRYHQAGAALWNHPLPILGLEFEGYRLLQLARDVQLQRLTHLGLVGELDEVTLQYFANSPYLTRLRSLSLNSIRLGPRGVTTVCQSAVVEKLQRLQILSQLIDGAVTQLQSVPECLARLQHLRLRGVAKDVTLLDRLLDQPIWERLRSLSLTDNEQIDGRRLSWYLASPACSQLEHLEIAGCSLDRYPREICPPAGSCQKLHSLQLWNCQLGRELPALLANWGLYSLKYLDLRSNRLPRSALVELANLECLRELRVLDLSSSSADIYQPLGPDGATILAQTHASWQHLESLLLNELQIGDMGVQALAVAPFARTLLHLHLNSCNLTDQCIPDLLRFPHLRWLSVCNNAFSYEGIGILRDHFGYGVVS